MSSKNKQSNNTPTQAPAPVAAPAPAPAATTEVTNPVTATPAEGTQAPEGAQDDSARYESILGTNSQPAIVKVGGQDVQLGEAVAAAHTASGLSVSEWNALSEEDRTALIAGVIDPVAPPPAPPQAPAPAPAAAPVASGGIAPSASAKVGDVAPAAAAAVVKKGFFSLELQGLVEQLSSNKVAAAAFAELEQYVTNMAPKRQMNQDQGAAFQVRLFRTLQLIINQTTDDFPRVFGTLLAVYHEFGIGKGALGPQHLFRFTEAINMTAEDRKGFHGINHMLVMLCDPQTRKDNLKHIDFSAQLNYSLTEDGRRRVLAFFGK